MLEYNPIVVYFLTLFVCLVLLLKALKEMCSTEEETPLTDAFDSPLITPEVYVIAVSQDQHQPQTFNYFDDSPPAYEIIASPPSYEEYCKEFEAMRVSSTQHQS